ncbi:MAG: aroE [Acidimicrobiales bacterium]|nr:aroE [Acidimicrobiales bacterium]
MRLTGATRVAAVIGRPIRHSLSPVLLNAAFEVAGCDWVFVAFAPAEGDARAAIDALRGLDLGGLSVTMPFKDEVAGLVDRLSPDAAALAAVNCVAWDDGQVVGHNTDGAGFLDSLRLDAGWDPAGKACVVLGGGGAARAVVRALARAGAGEVAVVNRTAAKAEVAAALAGDAGRVGAEADLTAADLVVNATSIGLGATDVDGPLPLDPDRLRAGQVVVDVVYQASPLQHDASLPPPARNWTPLLCAAAARGATPVDGLGMLIHQAGHAFELWTGQAAPIDAMRAAANGLRAG